MRFTAPVYNPYLPDHVSLAVDLRQQPHAISDVESHTPEVNNVTSGA